MILQRFLPLSLHFSKYNKYLLHGFDVIFFLRSVIFEPSFILTLSDLPLQNLNTQIINKFCFIFVSSKAIKWLKLLMHCCGEMFIIFTLFFYLWDCWSFQVIFFFISSYFGARLTEIIFA